MSLRVPSGEIKRKDGKTVHGKYLHRMVVYSFGDRLGNQYLGNLVIDHFDMSHKNNAVNNLEQITNERNLFRAYLFTRSAICKDRFSAAYCKLDSIDKMILDEEIKCDIENYNRKEGEHD